MVSWARATHDHVLGHRLLKATLHCRQCGRSGGDVVGYADLSLREARFIPPDTAPLPRRLGGQLRCARCAGQLYLDDVEPLGRRVPLEEAGGIPFASVIDGDERLGATVGRTS
jgi:hypothetical protein